MNTNNPLSTRAQKALEILENGGKFVVRLERDSYTGREQFRTRLVLNGHVQKGFGVATKHELNSMIVRIGNGTSVSDYYGLPYVHCQ